MEDETREGGFLAMLAKKRAAREPSELIDLYLVDLKERAGEDHYKNVRSQLHRMMKHLQDFDPARVMRYRAWRKSKRKSNRTINAEVKALSTFFEWAKASRLIDDNPVSGIRALPERPCDLAKIRRSMSDAEIQRFLAASEHRDKDLDLVFPMTRIWRALLETTQRWGRVVSLTVDDVGKNAVYLRPLRGKSGPARVVPIRPALAAELRSGACGPLLFVTPHGDPWSKATYGIARRAFYDTLRRAEIQRKDQAGRSLDIHALRYSGISSLARRGIDGAMIQKVAGHSTRAMTLHYTDFAEGDLVSAWKEKVWGKGSPGNPRGRG